MAKHLAYPDGDHTEGTDGVGDYVLRSKKKHQRGSEDPDYGDDTPTYSDGMAEDIFQAEYFRVGNDMDLLKAQEEAGTLTEEQTVALGSLRQDESSISYKRSVDQKNWPAALRDIKMVHGHVLRILGETR